MPWQCCPLLSAAGDPRLSTLRRGSALIALNAVTIVNHICPTWDLLLSDFFVCVHVCVSLHNLSLSVPHRKLNTVPSNKPNTNDQITARGNYIQPFVVCDKLSFGATPDTRSRECALPKRDARNMKGVGGRTL